MAEVIRDLTDEEYKTAEGLAQACMARARHHPGTVAFMQELIAIARIRKLSRKQFDCIKRAYAQLPGRAAYRK